MYCFVERELIMEKIRIEIKNCYGINNLIKEFDFTGGKSTQLIYAPNGVMKSSFANVFDDYSKGTESSDLIFKDRESYRNIIDSSTGEEIDKESIFVIRPYEKEFKSDKMSTLLVKDDLRNEYIKIHETINITKENLIKLLAKDYGAKGNIEKELSKAFGGDEKEFLKILESIEKNVTDGTSEEFGNIVYSKVFNEKVVAFLETEDFKYQIKKYIEKYNELISDSPFLKKEFNHYNALTVHKNLNENGFFKAKHTINLDFNGEKKEISDNKEFEKLIKDEKEKILKETSLQTIFDKIDKKITNVQLRDFRDYLFENQEILPELVNLQNLAQKIWIAYLKKNLMLYNVLLFEYKKGQSEILSIIERAKREVTDWESVIKIFNRRFYVPYRLSIKNKEDTILRDEAPSVHYHFQDNTEEVNENLLLKVLSQGERRALYLLNVIFEIESRKKQGIKTLFIVDDIADSFDYKNKYAIIEYLKDMSDDENFTAIILTHNFDFFRTVQERICGEHRYTTSHMAIKEVNQIILEDARYKYISNPLKNWKRNLEDPAKIIASVSFARNITEYTGDKENFRKLTAVLHLKPLTKEITLGEIEDIYKVIFNDLSNLNLSDKEKKMYDLIFEVADSICESESELSLNLENKVVLSIAIRLVAENFMINKINDESFISNLKNNQTGKLFGKYKEKFTGDVIRIAILEKVNIMTPENIHLNSFMFEPILDMSDFHLKQLYQEVTTLVAVVELEEAMAQAAATRQI